MNKTQSKWQHMLFRVLALVIFSILMLTTTALAIPVTYYVNNSGGSDSNDGLTPATAFKTIAKVNTLALNPGESVLFARGEVWRMTDDAFLIIGSNGVSENVIKYGAYGTGSKPTFLSSVNLSSTTNWINNSPTLWQTNLSSSFNSVGTLIYNNEESTGQSRYNLTQIKAQGEFMFNTTRKVLSVNSSSNPGSYYSNIEASIQPASSQGSIRISGNYIEVSNFSLKYSGTHGYLITNTHDVSILDSAIRFNGGVWQTSSNRLGDCFSIMLELNNILLEGNSVSQCYDTGLDLESYGSSGKPNNITNIIYRNNIVVDTLYGFEYFSTNRSARTDNVTIDHNTFAQTGNWFNKDKTYQYIRMSGSPANTTNFNFTNNIIYNNGEFGLDFGGNGWLGPNPNNNYNLYYSNVSGYKVIQWNMTEYSTLANFKLIVPEEQNSLESNPLFSLNYAPYANSPACNMSSTGSYVGALPCVTESEPEPEPEPEPAPTFCGDLTCDTNESCSICETDCGICLINETSFCGDSTCNTNESCSICQSDCGACPEQPTPSSSGTSITGTAILADTITSNTTIANKTTPANITTIQPKTEQPKSLPSLLYRYSTATPETKFSLDQLWFTTNNLTPEKITILAKINNTWKILYPTSSDQSKIYYTSDKPFTQIEIYLGNNSTLSPAPIKPKGNTMIYLIAALLLLTIIAFIIMLIKYRE